MEKENDILLDAFIDFPLYIVSENEKAESTPLPTSQAHTLILCTKAAKQDNLSTLLRNILNAVKLDLQNDILINYKTDEESHSLAEWRTKAPIRHILLFGIPPQQLDIQNDIPKYQPTPIEEINFLVADDLAAINTDKSLKKALWMALQKIY